MATNWREYQEEAADFFRTLGLDANTDVTLRGARTSHDVDVVVRSQHVGFEVLWLVECKHWQERVSKVHVLALRQIVVDIGADRGILLCEAGFQSGAIEASNLTNVAVTSLAEFRTVASGQVTAMRIRDLFDRVQACKERYWNISKDDRVEHGLRPGVPESGYSGAHVTDLVVDLLSKALRGSYPFTTDHIWAYAQQMPLNYSSPTAVFAIVEPLVYELEGKLDAYDEATRVE